jgi:hypothetical protein
MEYRIQVNPDKIDDFIQLLRTWKKLGIIEDFQLSEATAEPFPEAFIVPEMSRTLLFTPEAGDYPDQYRDLVD